MRLGTLGTSGVRPGATWRVGLMRRISTAPAAGAMSADGRARSLNASDRLWRRGTGGTGAEGADGGVLTIGAAATGGRGGATATGGIVGAGAGAETATTGGCAVTAGAVARCGSAA